MKKLNVKMFANYSIGDTSKLILLKGGARASNTATPQGITGKILCEETGSNGSRKDVQWDDGKISLDASDASYNNNISEK